VCLITRLLRGLKVFRQHFHKLWNFMHTIINNLLLPLSSTQSLHSTDAWHWNIYSFDIFVQNVTVINNFFLSFSIAFKLSLTFPKLEKVQNSGVKFWMVWKRETTKLNKMGLNYSSLLPNIKNFIEYQKI